MRSPDPESIIRIGNICEQLVNPSIPHDKRTVLDFRRNVLRELKKIKLAWPELNYTTRGRPNSRALSRHLDHSSGSRAFISSSKRSLD